MNGLFASVDDTNGPFASRPHLPKQPQHRAELTSRASSGYTAAGRGLNRHRKRQIALRAKLQAKQTKAAKRRLKARARKEARHVKNINHCISKTIVTEAKRTGRGISLEELKGIRDRVRLA
ncbi:hypothetical protein [Saccharopolyspora pogona]|uniref:hypothetical protein n=1 Tax=Saccharopolyspora pogona TaxID=333966 RepID=UPI001CC22758|nr:hypothetical protein [Saccharopolyspora pogona]